MRPLTRLAVLFGTVAVVTGLSLGPAGASPGGGSSPQQLTNIVVSYNPSSLWAPLFVGIEKGFFAEQGLQVTTRPGFVTAAEIAGLVSGSLDFTTAAVVGAFQAASAGIPVKMVAAGFSTAAGVEGVVVKRGGSIKVPADIKTMCLNSLGGGPEAYAREWFRQLRLNDKAVTFVGIPFANIPTAILQGRCDAGSTTQPFLGAALAQGMKRIGSTHLGVGPYGSILGAWVASDALIANKPELVEKFVAAILKSQKYASSHFKETRAILPKMLGLTPEAANATLLAPWPQSFGLKSLQKLSDLTLDLGLMQKPVKASDTLWAKARTRP